MIVQILFHCKINKNCSNSLILIRSISVYWFLSIFQIESKMQIKQIKNKRTKINQIAVHWFVDIFHADCNLTATGCITVQFSKSTKRCAPYTIQYTDSQCLVYDCYWSPNVELNLLHARHATQIWYHWIWCV